MLFIMSSISEKSILPSRLLSCLIAFSMFLLISSTFTILKLSDNSLIPKSVLQYILVNNSPIGPKPNVILQTHDSPVTSPVLPNKTPEKENIAIQEVVQDSGPTKKRACDETRARLKVYMYDLPPEFHFGLLGWKSTANQTWPYVGDKKTIPSYPGGLNLQHSTEYWLTLDLLASNVANVVRPCSAIRVKDSSEADLIFVPFFSSLSYNRHSKRHGNRQEAIDRLLQVKLVKFLKGRKEWKQFGGKDHLVVAHHPNSMLFARKKLGSCMFVLADFGRYPLEIANVEKDVIAPYKHMVKSIATENSAPFNERKTLMYFQGAIYRKDGGEIRQELYYLLKDMKDVHFTFGSVQSNGISQAGKGMASSKFCLNIAGDTPSSNRLFDAIASHCVPVIISDEIELPYEDVLDYSEFCIFVRSADAVKKDFLVNLLRGIKEKEWSIMWERLKEVSGHFEYQFPSRANDAVDMIWQTVARKKSPTQLSVHRRNRYDRHSRW